MPRPYSPALLERINQDDGKYSLGIDLAKHCVAAGLNATYIAAILETSRVSIHSWFRGGAIRHRTRPKVEVLIEILEEDMERGLLPVSGHVQAKAYAEGILGRPLDSKSLKASD